MRAVKVPGSAFHAEVLVSQKLRARLSMVILTLAD